MDIKKSIYTFLRAQRRCRLREEAGILYITTPDNEIWDMTIPMRNEKLTLMRVGAKDDVRSGAGAKKARGSGSSTAASGRSKRGNRGG